MYTQPGMHICTNQCKPKGALIRYASFLQLNTLHKGLAVLGRHCDFNNTLLQNVRFNNAQTYW